MLAYSEVMEDQNINAKIGRNVSRFFEKEEQRIVLKENQKKQIRWSRTPNTYYTSCVYVIGANNKIGFSNAYDKMECGRHFVCRGLQNGNRSGWTQSIAKEAVKEFGNMRKMKRIISLWLAVILVITGVDLPFGILEIQAAKKCEAVYGIGAGYLGYSRIYI